MSPIELVAAAITLVSIWLATREHLAYYPTGIVSTLLYGWLYFDARLYAESALQLVWLALLVYGWWKWKYGGAQHGELPVSRTPARMWPVVLGVGVALAAIVTVIQKRYTDNPAPLVDSSIAAFSIVAQWMTARKWLESWLFWIVVNVVAVPLYITRDLHPTAVLYFLLLILGIRGWFAWRRSLASA